MSEEVLPLRRVFYYSCIAGLVMGIAAFCKSAATHDVYGMASSSIWVLYFVFDFLYWRGAAKSVGRKRWMKLAYIVITIWFVADVCIQVQLHNYAAAQISGVMLIIAIGGIMRMIYTDF